MATNDDWLARGREEALEPDLPICDPHHHFWRTRQNAVEPCYLLDELMAAPERLRAMGQAARALAVPDAADRVARHCLEVAGV